MDVAIHRLRAAAQLPQYQTAQSAGMDLTACIEDPIELQPHQRVVVPTGFAIALPDGYEAQIRTRSGLALKHGIVVANGVGTIDADYRGEVGVIVLNTSDTSFTIEPNMRIAQMVIAAYQPVQWQEVAVLEETERGDGGFGSTGVRDI